MNPEVSILILTYNRLDITSEYIPKIIDNIGDISNEVLIWDNGSTDGSFDWVYSYGQADTRVTEIVSHETNIGMEAINHLAVKAKGRFILKIDDDIEVPKNFARRLVDAYEKVNEEKLLFLSWDMPWKKDSTFATRSGLKLYKKPLGKTIRINNRERMLINFDPKSWLINGACRLSPRDKFLEIGGHPEGIIYGVDFQVSERAAKHGYWGGYFSSPDLIIHCGTTDAPAYRQMKNKELARVGSPLHV